jgi:cyclohexadieny/prephenate dehydrogenase / 3-phosphoshikimate 1-carboxyvinyltransferase
MSSQNPLQDKSVLIVGLGMIGGSIACGLRAAHKNLVIKACDRNSEALQAAVSDGVLSGHGSIEDLCPEADLIIVCLPPLALIDALDDIARSAKETATITDVASVKSEIQKKVDSIGGDFALRFISGHPIAGSEQSGYHAAIENLFAKRNIILTPASEVNQQCLQLVNEMWRSLGANVLGMSAERHDQVLAATSHLPHLLAFGIVDSLVKQELSEDIFRYAAGGFADFSRLASSDPQMWSDIFVSNSKATAEVLDDYIDNLTALKKAITEKDRDTLFSVFAEANSSREKFIKTHFNPRTTLSTTDELETMNVKFEIEPGGKISGKLRVPGDKSISHRSIIFGSLADGVSKVKGFLEGEDALNTLSAFREMGVNIIGPENGELTIYGVGMHGLKAPRKPLYMGNSGTAMRLLAGLLAAQSFDSELSGDESLESRPMNRIANPLREMGAQIKTDEDGTPPLKIQGSELSAINYQMPMASAQVKSSILVAGMYAQGISTVVEPAICRDHTERMLAGFSYPVVQNSETGKSELEGGHSLQATDIDVPADISSAAFFLVAASIAPGSELELTHVGVNPTRIGIINLLKQMGADIEVNNEQLVGGEPVADLLVRHSQLKGIEIPEQEIPLAIDEFPVLFIAAACADGETVLRGAEELRVKESDRIDAMAVGLNALGIETEVFNDGIRINGGQIGGGEVDSRGDHRIAMAFTVAGLRSSSRITVNNCANVATSFPGFVELANSSGINISIGGEQS